jgi:HPt (histidine-containing phosphotransfer) domain-containing protein
MATNEEELPILDFEELIENYGDRDMAQMGIEQFLTMVFGPTSEFYPGFIERKLKEKDAKELKRGAHSIKGCGKYICAKRFIKAAEKLQYAAMANDFDKAEILFQELKNEAKVLDDYIQVLKAKWEKEEQEAAAQAEAPHTEEKPQEEEVPPPSVVVIETPAPPEPKEIKIEIVENKSSPRTDPKSSPKTPSDSRPPTISRSQSKARSTFAPIEEEKIDSLHTSLVNNSGSQNPKNIKPITDASPNSNPFAISREASFGAEPIVPRLKIGDSASVSSTAQSLSNLATTAGQAYLESQRIQNAMSPQISRRELLRTPQNGSMTNVSLGLSLVQRFDWTGKDLERIPMKKTLPADYQPYKDPTIKPAQAFPSMRVMKSGKGNKDKLDDYPFDKGAKCNIF